MPPPGIIAYWCRPEKAWGAPVNAELLNLDAYGRGLSLRSVADLNLGGRPALRH